MNKEENERIRELRIEMYGRVQGVLLRDRVKRCADNLGLKGYIANKEDGGVLIVVQGRREKINELLDWVNSGPLFVKIEGINYNWTNSSVKYKDFKISTKGGFIADKARALLGLGKSILGIQQEKIPVHVAVIPDGNRRWAREKGLEAVQGHFKAGAYENLEMLFGECKKLGIKYLSFWAFSTENWRRDKKEVEALFGLLFDGISKFGELAKRDKIRFRHIGRKDRLPKNIVSEMEKLEKETKNYSDFNVQLCLDYGGRDEIVRAINKILKEKVKKVDEISFSKYLDTGEIPEPDLIIRTSGEHRISGFMPWQGAYAEFYFADCYFPDFGPNELRAAITDYSRRIRRFGGTAREDLDK